MEKFFFSFLIVMCLHQFGWSQNMEREVVGSAGGQSTNNEISLQWTLGELIVNTEEEADLILCQGFHQGGEGILIKAGEPSESFEIKAFPNPTTEAILLTSKQKGTFDLTLFDLAGQALFQQEANFDNGDVRVSLADLPDAIYVLKITNDSKLISSLKIKKTK